MFRTGFPVRFACSWTLTILIGVSSLQAQVGVETVLAYKPSQKDVDYDIPSADQAPKCKLDVERLPNGSGWALYSPEGQILRRFMDTNGDQKVDQYRYFKHGLEVFRDLDTNANNQIDQCRWLNTAGTRWGVDKDEDGRIDAWLMISAEESSREAVMAFISRDPRRLAAVLVTAEDCTALGLSDTVSQEILKRVADVSGRMSAILSKTKLLGPQARWSRFDCSMLMPSLIPAETGKSSKDVLVYENVMAMVETAGQSGFVTIGEMVQVGNAWKLTQIPLPFEGESTTIAEGGLLLQTTIAAATTAEGLSPEMRELIAKLQTLDNAAPNASSSRDDITRYNVERARLLDQLSKASTTGEERLMWQRQRLEGIAAATQMSTFPNGLEELKLIEQQLRQSKSDRDLLALAVFQRLLAEYNIQLEGAKPEDRAKVQQGWLTALEAFAKEFPASPDAADALLQLAVTHEFNGNVDEARKWYQQLVEGYPQTQPARRGTGALNRLNLKGKRLVLSGQSLRGGTLDFSAYRGKTVAVIFWATWCKPCTEDLPQILELYRTHQKDGFEIVGVNLDSPGAPIQQYIENFRIPWNHLHEEGGLESRPAVEFGIISLPTMFLVDKTGTVASSGTTVEELKKLVPELVKR